MATVNLSPINGQFFLDNGQVNSLGFLYTYAAGTSTPVATYTDNTGTIQNGVIIQLGADGRPPNGIWIVAGTAVKFVLKDINENLLQTFDNIKGMDDISGLAANGVNGDITELTALTQLPAMVGMGIAPSAWSGINSSLDIGNSTSVHTGILGSTTIINNGYYDGSTYRYKINGFASMIALSISTGTMVISIAPSGTAGNAITFVNRFQVGSDGTVTSGKDAPSGYMRTGVNQCMRTSAWGLTSLASGNSTIAAPSGATSVLLGIGGLGHASGGSITVASEDAGFSTVYDSIYLSAIAAGEFVEGIFLLAPVSGGNIYLNNAVTGTATATYWIRSITD